MAEKTPLALVKEKFGEKTKLVDALEKLTGEDLWVSRTNKDKGLAHVSNAKLLRLYATFSEVKEKFGTREKLIDAVLELEKRGKDTGLRQRLSEWPVPRLFDAYRSAAKRQAPRATGAKAAKAPTNRVVADTKVARAPSSKSKAAKPRAQARKARKGKPAKKAAK
jgi:hypothetical protein